MDWKLELAVIPVSDVDLEKTFYTEKVGFNEDLDHRAGDDPADRMNGLPKYVASTTLEEVAWNNSTMIQGNVAQEESEFERQPGQDILIYVSGELVRTPMQHDLIDE